MTQQEARQRITLIQRELSLAEKHYRIGEQHFTTAREMIYNLYQMQGWKVLEYGSWRACVQAEFEKNQSTLYRQLAAAAVEQNISPIGRIGSIPERVLRPLAKKGFTADVQRTLYEIAQQVTGQGSVTSGTMNAVVETLGEAIVTGTFQDADGEQHPIFEGLKADVLARMVEVRKRHQQYLEPKNSTKIISAIDAIPSVDGQNNVVLTLTGAITSEQLKTLLKRNLVKITAWSEGADNE